MQGTISLQEQAAEVIAQVETVTLSDGVKVFIRPINYLQMIEALPFVENLAQKLFMTDGARSVWADPTQLLFKGGGDLTAVLMILTDRDREFFKRRPSDVLAIIAAVWRVNHDFFIREEIGLIKDLLGAQTVETISLLFAQYKRLTSTLSNSSSRTVTTKRRSSRRTGSRK